jgi:hypothetical protein
MNTLTVLINLYHMGKGDLNPCTMGLLVGLLTPCYGLAVCCAMQVKLDCMEGATQG